MKNKKENNRNIVYSTNPDFDANTPDDEAPTLSPNEQQLYLVLERHGGGKVATVVENFVGTAADLATLGKILKTKCGVGGSVKDGLIIIQGDNREKIMQILQKEGYKVKKKGG